MGRRICPRCRQPMAFGNRACPRCPLPVSSHHRRWPWLVIGVVLGAAAVTALPPAQPTDRIAGQTVGAAWLVDGSAAVALAGAEPDWLGTGPAEVRSLYLWAAAHRATLEYIPCYCGCGTNNGHRDNFECYFQVDGSDVVGYEEHGFG